MNRTDPERFSELVFYGVLLLVGYLAFIVIQPFLAPLAWAAIFALTLAPLCQWAGLRIGRTRAALVTTLGAALLIAGPLATSITMLANDIPVAVAFLKTLPTLATPERVQVAWDMIRQRIPVALPADPTLLVSEAAQRALAYLAPRLGALAANVAATLGSLVVMIFALFFLLRDGDRIGELVRRILPFDEDERERLIRETRDMVIASVGAGLAVAAVQGLIGGVAFWGLGMSAPVTWGAAIGFCSLIPVVGAALVWVPVAAWWLLSGDVMKGLVLVGVGAGVIGMADNVLRPFLLSGRTTVNGLVIFIGLLGGVGAFGFVGLVLGPVVLVSAGSLVEALARRERRSDPPAESAN